MDYCILSAKGETELELRVKEKIKLGWRPLGGICVSETEDYFFIHQAMIKEEK